MLKSLLGRLSVLALFLGLTLVGATSRAQVPTSGLLWKVSGNGLGKPSYLFGTYHLLSGTFIDTMTGVMAALDASEQVIGEMNMDSVNPMALFSGMGAVLDSIPLDKRLSKEDYRAVAKLFKEKTGMNIDFVKRFKPIVPYIFIYASSAKEDLDEQAMPKDPTNVLDIRIQHIAKEQGKRVAGLETAEQQMKALFNSFPLEKQIEMLMELTKESDSGETKERKIDVTKCYLKEDLTCLELALQEGAIPASAYDPILKDRNNNWIDALPAIMSERSSFVAVGALHLTGKDGLVSRLREKGYVVERVGLK